MSLLNAITISIGDELLSGKTIDSNNAFISRQLGDIGIVVSKKLIIGDVNENIKKALKWSLNEADVVTITGGLGPTHDDITKTALCEYFGVGLKTYPDLLEQLKERFAKRGLAFAQSNISQAEYPENARLLMNSKGTAQGMYFFHEQTHLFVMPGVPAEMRAITTEHIIPMLSDLTGAITEFVDIHSNGVPESKLYELTKPILDEYPKAKVAYLPKHFIVTIRVSFDSNFKGENTGKLNDIYARISDLLPANIFGRDEDSLSSVVGRVLKMNGATVATAESCTGGLIASMITDISGSSDYFNTGYVTYANETKMAILGVKEDTLIKHGAVSEETVSEMLSGTLAKSGADYAIAVSGVAGPTGGSEEKPVGTVYIGVADHEQQQIKRFQFGTDRVLNKIISAQTALNMLRIFIAGQLS
ncbi:MAG: CinA family nicotinamide mononucleotide deamidase-related protein [Candidatus Marinimicrobia bacterium]|nr:CinA family nicotinamide mononucleotide deamidase-related protein [Candidatus Neomarinimicrobiota bacterium]